MEKDKNEKNWYSKKWLKVWEYSWWEKRALKAIKRVKKYTEKSFPENHEYMLSIIYEEQSHLTPFENWRENSEKEKKLQILDDFDK